MSASEPLPGPPAGAPAPSDGTRSVPSGAAAAGATASAGANARTPPPARTSGSAPREVDPITLEVVCEGLIAIVREMRATIIRSSFSSVIYEFDDFSCALFGSGGEMVAQSWDHPGHVLPLPWGVRCMFEDFADDLHPGDVVLLNDPYRGGTHLNDVTLVHPIFDEDGNHSQAPITYGLTECRHAHRNHSSRGCFHPHRMCSDTTAQFQRPKSWAFSTPIGC